uniref:Uncharacterized protein n=1 Tax=Onchocerca volvulus TaxID=6282 RepID=A0A8R1XUN1_ONCVO
MSGVLLFYSIEASDQFFICSYSLSSISLCSRRSKFSLGSVILFSILDIGILRKQKGTKSIFERNGLINDVTAVDFTDAEVYTLVTRNL